MFSFDDVVRQAGRFGIRLEEHDRLLAQNNPDAGMALINCQRDYRTAKTDSARALAHSTAMRIRASYAGPASDAAENGGQGGRSPADFQWDPARDAGYQSYRTAYLQAGKRAAQDAIGSAAVLSGGVPSSYAVTAGTEAAQQFAGKLAEKEGELRDAAYKRYTDELSYRSALEKEAYKRERDRVDDAYRFGLQGQNAPSVTGKAEAAASLPKTVSDPELAPYSLEDLLYLRDNGYAPAFRAAGYDIDRMISELRKGGISK